MSKFNLISIVLEYGSAKKLVDWIFFQIFSIFFGFDDLSSMIEHEVPSDKSVFESSNGVFGYNEPFYKHCYSRKVVKTG